MSTKSNSELEINPFGNMYPDIIDKQRLAKWMENRLPVKSSVVVRFTVEDILERYHKDHENDMDS